ncbi:toxin [Pseudomonas syringae]|nr:toxin [Pseudomonas syringae]MCF5068057.1 toxin [Pseudomonas syringae]
MCSTHARTPTLLAQDPRRLNVRQIAYLRKAPGGATESLITHQTHNVAGQLAARWDSRLFDLAPSPNLATLYTLMGDPLRIDSADAGWRLHLPGVAGQALQRWDARSHHWHMNYDDQLRLTGIEESTQQDRERLIFANALANPDHNVRGRLIEHGDPSGTVRLGSYDLLGQTLDETRTLAGDEFSTGRRYNPLGALLSQTDAGGHQQQMRYTVAGQLKQVFLQLENQSQQPILQDAQYNAAAQIATQITGNGVISTWEYDPADHRLIAQKSGKPGQALYQHLSYEHDPMGNVLRIDDHTLATVYFANQQVRATREFSYDSLYRLIRANGFEAQIPNLEPGLPVLISPIDSGRRFNYTELYDYDAGNNLTELRHVRQGNTYTRSMRIDAVSNRGVRWQEGDPEPIFDERFDAHGNARDLYTGSQPLLWNVRDQLARVTLLKHSNGLPDDEESYLYSRGERVYKRLLCHTPSSTRRHEVRYLPGLEIHTRSDGQTLHVISLALGLGNVRCLHWVTGQPAEIEPDQLRYHGDDHLGTCALELDREGALMSLEFSYPFGGCAWRAARNVIEAPYKTLRYSGKEMDASGLCYFGARYLAPWLQRWISADPAGDVDGLNLYAMVGNNPLRYVDVAGTSLEESAARQAITDYSNFLTQVNSELAKINHQLYNITRTRDIYKSAGKRLILTVTTFAVAIQAGAVGATISGGIGAVTGPAAPVVATVGAIIAAETATKIMEKVGEETTWGHPIMPSPDALSVKSLKAKAAAGPFGVGTIVDSFTSGSSESVVKTVVETTARAAGKHLKVPYLKQALNIARQMAHLTEALNGSVGQGDMDRISTRLNELETFFDQQEPLMQTHFATLENATHLAPPVDLAAIREQVGVMRGSLKQARNLTGRVWQFLEEKKHAA